MTRMNRDSFKRKYEDTHAGLQAGGILETLTGKGQHNKYPSDLNARNVKHLKKPIERELMEKRSEDFNHYLLDAVEVRAEDILDKQQVPMKDLLKIAVSSAPKHVKVEANVTNTFAALWETSDIDKTEYDEVEDGEVTD